MKQEYLFGINTIAATLKHNPHRIKKLFISQKRSDQRIQTLIDSAKQQGIAVETITEDKLQQWLGSAVHQGIVAQVKPLTAKTETELKDFLPSLPENAFILILDGVQDPHNLGACLRSADAAGVDCVIVPKDRAASLTPLAQKTASGAAETIPFFQITNLARTIKLLQQKGIWIYGLSDKANKSLYEADLKGAIALVLGAEGKGMRHLTQDICDDIYYLPMAGSVSSLNVSVAAGVAMFEVVRQRIVGKDN